MPAALVFDKYEVIKRIAVGGMGEVFLAQDPSGKRVILKGLRPERGAAAELNAQRFLDEARLAAKLDHPNVVRVFEVGASGGKFFIAMEYLPGWNLAQLLRRAHALGLSVDPWLLALIVRDAARGLHHSHAGPGIVHRDVSPQNIVVRQDGVTKVVDFGVAAALDRAQPGTLVGKAGYLAPEQRDGAPADARSDQYALGVVFWELLTARRLHDGAPKADVPHPTAHAPEVPRTLGDIAMRMLRPAPADRFPDCEAAALALDALLPPGREAELKALLDRLGPVPAEAEAERPQSAAPTPAPARSKLPLVAAASVLAAGLAAFALTRAPKPRGLFAAPPASPIAMTPDGGK